MWMHFTPHRCHGSCLKYPMWGRLAVKYHTKPLLLIPTQCLAPPHIQPPLLSACLEYPVVARMVNGESVQRRLWHPVPINISLIYFKLCRYVYNRTITTRYSARLTFILSTGYSYDAQYLGVFSGISSQAVFSKFSTSKWCGQPSPSPTCVPPIKH
jgi:hypothetical protein